MSKEVNPLKGVWVQNPGGRILTVPQKDVEVLLKKGFKRVDKPQEEKTEIKPKPKK